MGDRYGRNYIVTWTGPHGFPDDYYVRQASYAVHEKAQLYQVYGRHPLYGDNVLLYIGATGRPLGKRLDEHFYRGVLRNHEPLARRGATGSPVFSYHVGILVCEPTRPLIEADALIAEANLIPYHAPALNGRNVQRYDAPESEVQNTGARGHLAERCTVSRNNLSG
jgi:hypothetical protein